MPVARRPLARLRRPRRAAPRGLPDACRRRPGAAPDLARRRRAWCAAGRRPARSSYVTTHGQPFFRNHQRVHGRAERAAAARALGLGQVNHHRLRRRRQRDRDRPQHRRPRALEALPRRHAPARSGSTPRAAARSAASTELAGNVTTPDVDRRSRLLPRPTAKASATSIRACADGGDLRRHTDHDDYYARHAQSDGTRIVYAVRRRASGCSIPAQRQRRASWRSRRRRTAPQAARTLRAAQPSTSGGSACIRPATSVAVDARGKLFAMPLWEGARDAATTTPAGAMPAMPATPPCACAAAVARRRHDDDRGERCLGRRAARRRSRTAAARTLPWDIGRVSRAARGAASAVRRDRQPPQRGLDRRRRRAAQLSAVDRSDARRAATISPGRPTARGSPTPSARSARHAAIKLLDVARATHDARSPSPSSATTAPSFDPDGRYSLLPVDAHLRSGLRQRSSSSSASRARARPYLIALQRRRRCPFDPEPQGLQERRRCRQATRRRRRSE